MWSLFLTLACSVPEPVPPAAPAVDHEQVALDAAEAAAKKLGGTLRERLTGAMTEGGPTQAIGMCADEAQGLTAGVAGETKASVGRSSLRLRNPANAAPEWVAAWLAEQGERPAEGVTGFAKVIDGKARVLKPIAVEAPCVACHGPKESLEPAVATLLTERYPTDQATGYAVGDLRGALWAEVAVAQ